MEKKTYTISLYTEKNIGVLNRLSAVFLKRHLDIHSVTASKSEIEDIFRIIFVVKSDETEVKKVVKQLEKQIEVVAAYYHTNGDIIYQETAMFKIKTEYLYDEEIQKMLRQRRMNIVTVTEPFFVIETTGSSELISELYDKLKPYNLLQFVRSGVIAITRPRMAISDLLEDFANLKSEKKKGQ